MTDTTTLAPTDAEIEELLKSCGMRWAERSFWQFEDADLHPAIRAILAKWGAPAPANGDTASPFGYFRAEPFGWTKCAESDEGARPLYEAPPVQEARVPLSDEQADAIALVEFERHCGRPHPWEGAQPWVIAAIKAAHGITAKEPT